MSQEEKLILITMISNGIILMALVAVFAFAMAAIYEYFFPEDDE